MFLHRKILPFRIPTIEMSWASNTRLEGKGILVFHGNQVPRLRTSALSFRFLGKPRRTSLVVINSRSVRFRIQATQVRTVYRLWLLPGPLLSLRNSIWSHFVEATSRGLNNNEYQWGDCCVAICCLQAYFMPGKDFVGP